MHQSPLKAHVRLDTHPAHPSAVTASLTGTHHRTAQAILAARAREVRASLPSRCRPFWFGPSANVSAAF